MKKMSRSNGAWYAMAMFVGLVVLPAFLVAQDKGTFKDIRDGRDYRWMKIGPQVWMTENLRYNVPAASWAYNNDTVSEAKFGLLYTWKAAQTACPRGWHLPSDKDWSVLIQSLGGNGEAGLKMQSLDTAGRVNASDGIHPAGFVSSLLGGVRHPDGSCIGINTWGGCWSSGKVNDTVANNVLFAHGAKEMSVSSNDKNAGFSVRCVKK
jgi:uncharacterized protein (TIGR02145 family)